MPPHRRQPEESRDDAPAAQCEAARTASEGGEPECCGFDPLECPGHAVSRRSTHRIHRDRTISRTCLRDSQPTRPGCGQRNGAAGRAGFARRPAARLLSDRLAGTGYAVQRDRLLLGDSRSGPAQSESRFPLLHGRRVECHRVRTHLSAGRAGKRDPILRRTGPAGRSDLRPRTHPSGSCGTNRGAV